MQKMDTKKRNKYNEFIDTYKTSIPILNRLKATLDKIPEGEFFYTSNKSEHTTKETLFIGNLVDAHKNALTEEDVAANFKKITEQMDGFFGRLLKSYEFIIFSSEKSIKIGESDRRRRICRFCNRGMNTKIKTTFKSKAHAFSEALGNKSVILNEECDECNRKLGSLEDDFITYLDIYRVFYKIKGKNGIAKLKFKNGSIQEIDGLTTISSRTIEHTEESGNFTIILESNRQIATVNIYKTLCKYALSVIDKNELTHFEDTINWITSDENKTTLLPKIAIGVSSDMYVDAPALGLYMRKNDTEDGPHVVAEFRFKALLFIFIVPFSSKDRVDFVSNDSYKEFWDIFEHYSTQEIWNFYNFSRYSKEEFEFKVNMIKSEDLEKKEDFELSFSQN